MQIQRFFPGLFFATLTLLSATVAAAEASTDGSRPTLPGSDRDAHGCIPSAGYAWCGKTQRCERPWELAREHGFATSREAFERFCGNEPIGTDTANKDRPPG